MIINKIVDLGVANLCCASASAGHKQIYPNKGDGAATQLSFNIMGGGTAYSEALGITLSSSKSELVDMEPLMGYPFEGICAENSLWVSINPKPESKRFDYQLIRGEDTANIAGDASERVLISLLGAIEANGVEMTEHKFARIKDGQQVSVHVPQGSVALVLTTRA